MPLPVVFADIYKPVKDLLTKQLNGDQTKLETKTIAQNGQVFSANTALSGGVLVGDVSLEFPIDLFTELKFKSQAYTDGKLLTKVISNGKLVPGLRIEAASRSSPNKSSLDEYDVLLEYLHAKGYTATLESHFSPSSGPVQFNSSLSLAYTDFIFGVAAGFDSTFSALTKYALGFRYRAADHVVAGTWEKSKALLGWTHIVSPTSLVGAEYEHDFKQGSVSVALAGEHRPSKDFSLKGKVSTKGTVQASATEQLNPNLKVTLSSETKFGGAPVKWGLVFNYEA